MPDSTAAPVTPATGGSTINWAFWVEKGVSLLIALATAYLNSRGKQVTPQQLAANAQQYMSEAAKDLSDAGDAYLNKLDQG